MFYDRAWLVAYSLIMCSSVVFLRSYIFYYGEDYWRGLVVLESQQITSTMIGLYALFHYDRLGGRNGVCAYSQIRLSTKKVHGV